MPKITIDGKTVECRENIPVLRAALEAGFEVPHYCYHPGLSVVASCRLCLMQMKMPHPKTKELDWAPKLFPSCQTPVKDGMEVKFDSQLVHNNTNHVMEYYLINHPLDCPVCDKAGECYLQDYTEDYGPATSRMVEEKNKNPKKDIGSQTLLYQDRCVLCTRCVRFTQEVAGTSELTVINRGNRGEIDVFPGEPLENPLQANVVDICPVGALLDKNFLFQQRVWLLKPTKSVSPADARGSTVYIDVNDDRVWRIRPRFNEKVNEWWISDESRFSWQHVHSPDRLNIPMIREESALRPTRWPVVQEQIRAQLNTVASDGGSRVAIVLSPMMSCEEAWLLASFVRQSAPQATFVIGYVPVEGTDQTFPKGFVISAEKCPNRRGVETVIEQAGGPSASWDEFLTKAGGGEYRFALVTGGYPKAWIDSTLADTLRKIETVVLHDVWASALDDHLWLQLPSATWVEREGSFMNADGLVQPFDRALKPLDGVVGDGQFYYELAGHQGLFRSRKVRELMAAELPTFGEVFVPREEPEYAH